VPLPSAVIGDRVQVAVRPEWHELMSDASPLSPSMNGLYGTIREIIFLGETLHVLVTLRDGATARVALRNPGMLTTPLKWRPGDSVRVAWSLQDVQVLEP
jgi:hypothetical protein